MAYVYVCQLRICEENEVSHHASEYCACTPEHMHAYGVVYVCMCTFVHVTIRMHVPRTWDHANMCICTHMIYAILHILHTHT